MYVLNFNRGRMCVGIPPCKRMQGTVDSSCIHYHVEPLLAEISSRAQLNEIRTM